ncbi:MAG TPA: membrane protein insertion efficiency factor YidD [Acholeplasma sp.]|nr:membrane protein insertion efficiency factor YidD [Acholeplasma sp.]
MNKLMIKLIKFYQKYKPDRKHCRHYPTCSNYALEAYEKFNFFYATFLTIKRILKCNPLFKPKYDPVPLSRKEKQALKKAAENSSKEESNSLKEV